MEVVNTTSTTNPVNMYNYLNTYILNPMVFIIIFLIIVAYYVFSSSSVSPNGLGNITGSNSNSGINIMSIIIIAILIVLVIINAFEYFFSINVTAYIQGLFSPKTQVDIVVDQSSIHPSPSPVPTIRFKKQVFNIPGNYYNYTNAKALCKAYGAELASYDQLEKAYNDGAEWCNYGWSSNQLALFPTQQKTYNTLQTIKGHENDCGRPGVNGGYIANPQVRFGVNCYGNKPKIRSEEEELMKTTSPYPETLQDKVFQKKVDFWKDKVDEILVSPFNHNSWGQ
uniref:Link domain-containing protein n=1 Tax=viral metagenome TaxID=1070528 RepID=A0A6C0AQN0_9ZZZZ